MKPSKNLIRRKFRARPELRFEDQTLTSYAGLILFQRLFERLSLRNRLGWCFRHLPNGSIFPATALYLQLIVHVLLGFRSLRQQAFYRQDPMVLRVLGLSRLPTVSTVSRFLTQLDDRAVDRLAQVQQAIILERLSQLNLNRVTLDFDGSVLGTRRKAEGTAVGFNRKKKGQRSYYPLFCTVAQTGQTFDVLYRSGNVHDSNGAKAFILGCIEAIRAAMPTITIEVRMDGAFFGDELLSALESQNRLEYSVSVPFARFPQLKQMIESRTLWNPIDADYDCYERHWKPASWTAHRRFVMVRQRVQELSKTPLQLDLFEPVAYDYAYSVIVTNKPVKDKAVVRFHHGRGSQEGLFAELKSDNHLDYIPCQHWYANQGYLLSITLAHNLSRELQMVEQPPTRALQPKRPAMWCFQKLNTVRQRLVQQAGRLLNPQGKLVLSMAQNEAIEKEYRSILERMDRAA